MIKRIEGISIISLIISIIVIIILAAIVIFSGLNTPDRANFAKFAQSFSDYNTAIMGDFSKKKTKYAVEGYTRTDAQIYYIIATGNENIVDVNDAPTPAGTIEELGLQLYPEGLNGTEYYQITEDKNIDGINKQIQFFEVGEKHYVTDKGEAFMLPGYLVSENGTNKWYINERKYYTNDNPIASNEDGWRRIINDVGINSEEYQNLKEALIDINNDNEKRNLFTSNNEAMRNLKDITNINDDDLAGLVPILTSNNSTSDIETECGVASESSYWWTESRKAWAAFNGNTENKSINNCWQATDKAPSTGSYIRYMSTTNDTIMKVKVGTFDDNNDNTGKTWTTYIRGSVDGENWNKISNDVVLSVQKNEIKNFEYEINDLRQYKYYDVFFQASSEDATYVAESYKYSCSFIFLQFYGLKDISLLEYAINKID